MILQFKNSSENELIAEFMNIEIDSKEKIFIYIIFGDKYAAEGLKYDKSWNWLMPVIEKISLIEFEDTYTDEENIERHDTSYPRTFGMPNKDKKFMFRFNRYGCYEADTLINAAYLAVVDYIKSYNEHKK